ncbi:hypothetical protein N7474_002284 [Penicillium riverlandense]|uniref:uncharacterized protein n=1 Tax=Penicillium riverlandense TaxID=1903569 RepID=UPI002548DC10|nr:uncharacterized protein N7474_002284 [Penicillium riverlandense]KAJ5833973.1 hypothetical protein N7474_002284 [Penicillium riverlandense]
MARPPPSRALFEYEASHNAIVYGPYRIRIPARLKERHLYETYGILNSAECRRHLAAIPDGTAPLYDHSDFTPLLDGSQPLPSLAIYDL